MRGRGVRRALSIAGSDSGGGAGVQADLKTFAALGVHGMTAITSITAQNTRAVTRIMDVEPDVVRAQIEAVVEDIGVDAAKTGMLRNREVIEVVSAQVQRHRFPLVVDPVMISKSGARLMEESAVEALTSRLIPLATVLTPNRVEAEAISGITIMDLEDAKRAAERILKMGPKAVVVKGGHIGPGPRVTDVFCTREGERLFEADRLDMRTTHGTGCAFSAAIAAEIAKGRTIVEAVERAKSFITSAIRFGIEVGAGCGPVNPMAQLYNLSDRYDTLQNLKEGLRILEESREFAHLIPESQSNLGMALPFPQTRSDIAAVPGRIVKIGERAKASAPPEFNASRHVADAILAANASDPEVRSALNIRVSGQILEACKQLGFTVSFYDRRDEPTEIKAAEGKTIGWGVRIGIEKFGAVPDVIYHEGDFGKEPMAVIFGRSAAEVAAKAVKLAKRCVTECQHESA